MPISSTGHLLVAEHWLGARSDLFNIAIQAGAILAVVLIYRQRLLELVLGLGKREHRDYSLKLALSFGVTAVLGLAVKKFGFQLPETIGPVAWALLVGGFVMLGAEAIAARRAHVADDSPAAISWGVAALVGVAQVVAGVFPGTSRSAAAIFAALLFGRGGRVAATEFAFLVGIPTMFAATGYELLHTLKDGGAANEDWSALGVALVVSALTAFAVVKWLLRYIQTHRFTVFSWYRIALGIVLLAWLHAGVAAPPVAPAQTLAATSGGGSLASNASAAASVGSATGSTPLAVRATAGRAPIPLDEAAARKLDLERFQAAKLCVQAEDLRWLAASASLETFVGLPDNQDLSAADRQAGLDEAKNVYDLMDRADVECPRATKELTDGSIYELALRAAQAGDERAASCYVGGGFPMPKESWNGNAEAQARFREHAIPLIERGLQRGDWSMVPLAKISVNPKRYRISYEPVVGNSLPGYVLAFNALHEGDAERSYGLARLQQIGAAPAIGENYDSGYVDFIAKSLSEAQRQAAEAWAQGAFLRYFHGRRWEHRDLDPCPL
ncbi:MAG: undecaprenyl-diphosphate phosphatase [Arenimonas sp.]